MWDCTPVPNANGYDVTIRMMCVKPIMTLKTSGPFPSG